VTAPVVSAPSDALVDVLLCGSPDRGDDGAALAAAVVLRSTLPPRARMRPVGQLDVEDLLAVPDAGGVVIVDAATGIAPGAVFALPLDRRIPTVRTRSSHALAIPDMVELAATVRGRPVTGRIVVVGALHSGLGERLSDPVAAAIPRLVRTVAAAVDAVLAEAGPIDAPGVSPNARRSSACA